MHSSEIAITTRTATITQMNTKRGVPKPTNFTMSPLRCSAVAVTPRACHGWTQIKHVSSSRSDRTELSLRSQKIGKMTLNETNAHPPHTHMSMTPLLWLLIQSAEAPIMKLPAFINSAKMR